MKALPRLLLFAACLAAPLVSCGGSKKAIGNLADADKEQQLLQDSARLYWEGLRWQDSEKAGAFIEDAELRVLFRDWLEDHFKAHRVEEATMLQVILGPEIAKPVDGRLQTGTVYVRSRGFTYPAQIVEDERVKQQWYRSVNGWFVDWTLPEDEDAD